MDSDGKFRVLSGLEIEREPTNHIDDVCNTDEPDREIIETMERIGFKKIALVWIGSGIAGSIIHSKHLDTSCVVPGLSKHDFIGHLTSVITFANGSIDPMSYRIFPKNSYQLQ
jgi:hypothetical protein